MVTKLQMRREAAGLTIEGLAQKVGENNVAGSLGHIVLTIRSIETGVLLCPRARKGFEYKELAKALKCTINDIID